MNEKDVLAPALLPHLLSLLCDSACTPIPLHAHTLTPYYYLHWGKPPTLLNLRKGKTVFSSEPP